jgi:ribonuclease BN (tRNA processing enzyme)
MRLQRIVHVAATWAVLAAASHPARVAALDGATRPESTTVILLGTGNPYPSAKAQGPATAVVVGRRIFLFDAGPGVVRQMEAAGLPVRRGPVTALFLTHLHSDHTLGYPDLLFTSWVMGRRSALRVYGPPGTQRMTEHILAAWDEDIHIREQGLEHAAPGGYRADVHEITGGVVYDSAGVRVRAIPVAHGSWKWAFAYRVDSPGKSIVLSGDTSPSPALEEAARGVDLLVHEVYPESRLAPESRPSGEDWPRYMRSFHTSDHELGALAGRAQPKKLVLVHVSSRLGATDEELLRGIREGGFAGPTVIGHDLDRF